MSLSYKFRSQFPVAIGAKLLLEIDKKRIGFGIKGNNVLQEEHIMHKRSPLN